MRAGGGVEVMLLGQDCDGGSTSRFLRRPIWRYQSMRDYPIGDHQLWMVD
jgi:hypothetical protein